jgi:hypothetical protein
MAGITGSSRIDKRLTGEPLLEDGYCPLDKRGYQVLLFRLALSKGAMKAGRGHF